MFLALAAGSEADAVASSLRDVGKPGRPVPRGTGALSKRETEVLRRIAEGLTNDQIARLFISKRAAEHHVSGLLGQLGVDTRTGGSARPPGRKPAGGRSAP